MPSSHMANNIEYHAFTISYLKQAKRLLTTVGVIPIFTINGTTLNTSVKAKALWDTGATLTCIKPALFQYIAIPLLGAIGTKTMTGIGGKIEAPAILVNLFITSTLIIEGCPAFMVDLPKDIDILIGMDIIGMGDFAVCNTDSKTSFSFAMPPFPDRINLTDKAKNANKLNKGRAKEK